MSKVPEVSTSLSFSVTLEEANYRNASAFFTAIADVVQVLQDRYEVIPVTSFYGPTGKRMGIISGSVLKKVQLFKAKEEVAAL